MVKMQQDHDRLHAILKRPVKLITSTADVP